MTAQRSFQLRRRSPWPGQTLDGRMPSTKAARRERCPLCPIDIKPGQRIAKLFSDDLWGHIGCVVREINHRNYGDVSTAA